MMDYMIINRDTWERKEYFEHYLRSVYKRLHADRETGC